MNVIPINVAVEDRVSGLVVLKLRAVAQPSYHVGATYRRGGFGYLRRTIKGWNAAAAGKPLLLADADNLAAFLHIGGKHVPQNPGQIADPKAALIELARLSRLRDVRDSIVPRQGSTAEQGPGYNECLGTFVQRQWDVRAASLQPPSLAGTLRRLDTFKPLWSAV